MLVNTPPMGWNSWNTFGENVSDTLIREMADAIVEKGLDKAGYKYVVIDDGWSERNRDPRTDRIVPNKQKFPNGIKPVADYVHSKGLKFGIYSCAGVRTCADYPGSFDHEFLDAKTFAEWGVDYLKYDYCFHPTTANGPLLYHRMGNALRASGRDILFSACNWGSEHVWSWIRSTGAHMYRSTGDIVDNFDSVRDIFMSQVAPHDNFDLDRESMTLKDVEKTIRAAGGNCSNAPGCFNDIDMLTVGMFGKGLVGSTGCDATDYKTEFALWCLFGSPLILGADVRKLTPEMLELVKNKGLLAINQDPECRTVYAATNLDWNSLRTCYAKLLANGDIALGFFNLTESDVHVYALFEGIGFPSSCGVALRLRDAMTGEEIGLKRDFHEEFLKKHDCRVLIATPEWL